MPLGLQSICQFETSSREVPPLSPEGLVNALRKALLSVDVMDTVLDSSVMIAEGCVVSAHWKSTKGGNIVLTWDGRTHLDLNLFTGQVKGGEEFANKVEIAMMSALQEYGFERVLRDDQPRGVGRVVVYPKPRGTPVWGEDDD